VISWTLPALTDALPILTANITDEAARHGLAPVDIQTVIMAAEEIFVNIAEYAYRSGQGEVLISCTISRTVGSGSNIILDFSDEGVPYNPLNQPEPDITLGLEQRRAGGLGIFMVRQLVDHVEYRYEDNKNKLRIINSIKTKED